MNKTLSYLIFAFAALWQVKLAGDLSSVFYCMSTITDQKIVFMIWGVGIFLISLLVQLFILYINPATEYITLCHSRESGNP